MRNAPIDHGTLVAEALVRSGARVELNHYDAIPPGRLDRRSLAAIRALLARRADDDLVLFCPGLREYYVPGSHLSVHFSGYRGLGPAPRICVIAQPWGLATPGPEDALRWSGRPPPRLGFMGSTYGTSRVAQALARSPHGVRDWILRGGLVADIDRLALAQQLRVPIRYAMAFPRFQAIAAVQQAAAGTPCEVEVVETIGFTGTAAARRAFADHLLHTTYVLCPRGCENYSFRVYEALRFGRVPVIVDTDMVLPHRDRLNDTCLFVDYAERDRIVATVLRDHAERSAADFATRQDRALAYSRELLDGEWLARDLAALVAAQPINRSSPLWM